MKSAISYKVFGASLLFLISAGDLSAAQAAPGF